MKENQRLHAWAAIGYVQGIWFIAIELFALAVIGLVWARERVLFDVHAHQRTLTTWTWIAVDGRIERNEANR